MARYVQHVPPMPPEYGLPEMRASWKVLVPPAERPTRKMNPYNIENIFSVTLRDSGEVALIDGEAGAWIPAGFEVVHQQGDGLGERLANGFDELGPGLIIGMDTPSAGRYLDAAIAAVRDGDDAIADGADRGTTVQDPFSGP